MNIEQQFKIPIMYNPNVRKINENIQDNLELSTLYPHIFGTTDNNFNLMNFCSYYSNDVLFLKQQQHFIHECINDKHILHHDNMSSFYNEWKDIMLHPSIRETYYYIDWDHLDFINYKSNIMLLLSLYNLSSPVITLITPFICILIPFIILKFYLKIDVTFHAYKTLFFQYTKHNIFGKMIHNLFNPDNIHQQMSGLSMLLFFFASLYQNILMCIKFYKNMFFMKSYIQKSRMLCVQTIQYIDIFQTYTKNKKTFKMFSEECSVWKKRIKKIVKMCYGIQDSVFHPKNMLQIGKYMSLFYTFRNDPHIPKTFKYCFELHEYVDNILHIGKNIKQNYINTCKYSDKISNIKSSYYIAHKKLKKCITNDIKIKKNIIITGPNASGKTTMIKSIMINILLSQQIGYGCYAPETKIHVYDNFYSYLNIPDTSERDSLFQAEARRCLEIIHALQKKPYERSFLIFDELYSGTNPREATLSAISFMNYIQRFPLHFMITTHYYDICTSKYLSTSIQNMHMKTDIINESFEYKYKIGKGPSYKQGGIKILEKMNYPENIITQIKQMDSR